MHRPPRGPPNAAFRALLARWDARLARSGFRDLEAGADLNNFHASTFDGERIGPRGARRARFVQVEDVDTDAPVLTLEDAQREAETLYGSPSLGDLPRARAWATFSEGAHSLPDGREKNILLAVAEAGCISAAIRRRYRKSRQNIRSLFTKHCRELGLPTNKLLVPGRTRKRA